MGRLNVAVGGLAIFFLGACMMAGSTNWFNRAGKDSLAKRAAFDLNCQEKQLLYTPVGVHGEGYDVVGVTCGYQRATYTFQDKTGSWTTDKPPQGTAPAQPPVPVEAAQPASPAEPQPVPVVPPPVEPSTP